MFKKIKFYFQRLFRGWDDSETWNLDFEFYKWFYSRLKRFKQISLTCPKDKTREQWAKEIDAILTSLEIILDEDNFFRDSIAMEILKHEVLTWFTKNINNLWW